MKIHFLSQLNLQTHLSLLEDELDFPGLPIIKVDYYMLQLVFNVNRYSGFTRVHQCFSVVLVDRSLVVCVVFCRLTRRVTLVEQELPTLPEHLSSPMF
jgi:hypothetical protein